MNVVLEAHWTCSTILEYASVQKQSAVNADDNIRISAISKHFLSSHEINCDAGG